MMKYTTKLPLYTLALGLAAALGSPPVQARCGCPSDKNGAPEATIGLGEAYPDAPDLSANPTWKVYRFERDGIEYVQVNDQYGNVRAAVGMIGTTSWVLPIGDDADRVTTASTANPAGIALTLYNADGAEVTLYQDGTLARWKIRAAN